MGQWVNFVKKVENLRYKAEYLRVEKTAWLDQLLYLRMPTREKKLRQQQAWRGYAHKRGEGSSYFLNY